MEKYDLELKVKNYLIKNKIRLCDPPYIVNKDLLSLEKLSNEISQVVSCEAVEVEIILNSLRLKSLKNIDNSKSEFLIKVYSPKLKETFNVTIDSVLNETGFMFRQKVADVLMIDISFLQIIFKGKLLRNEEYLLDQGLRNNSKVMVLEMSKPEKPIEEFSIQINQSRNLADYLSKRALDGDFKTNGFFLEITNQSGEVLSLSNEDKMVLTYGLAMHKQATKFIMNGNYQLALLHCLESEEAFSKSNYSDQIDNVAILQLDIVWCYYSLQNMDDLQDAKRRVHICEERMKKCYGEGNERIRRIRQKKTFEGIPESVHMFRLYLMKSIICYYENDNFNSRYFLSKSLEVYRSMVISEDLITQVMLLGFSRNQAIKGLQVHRDIESAVTFILQRTEDKSKLKLERTERKVDNAIERRLGLTSNGSKIQLNTLKQLVHDSNMDSSLCLAAIRRANNNYNEAIDLLSGSESILRNDIELDRSKGMVIDGDLSYQAVITEKQAVQQILQVIKLPKSQIKRMLRQYYGDVEAVLSHIFDDINETSSTSSISSGSHDSINDASSDSALNIEADIYREMIETDKNNEKQYFNPDLSNEIIVFNKFANLLHLEEISYVSENFIT